MDTSAISNVVISTVSALGLWFLLFWPYREYSVDRFREEMSQLRDSLFDAADCGLLGFDHPAYGILRSALNGFIRSADQVGLAQVFIGRWILAGSGRPVRSFRESWDEATADLPVDRKAELEQYLTRTHVAVIRQILVRSPIVLVTLVVPLVTWVLLRVRLPSLLSLLRKPLDHIDSAALVYGQ